MVANKQETTNQREIVVAPLRIIKEASQPELILFSVFHTCSREIELFSRRVSLLSIYHRFTGITISSIIFYYSIFSVVFGVID
jgi:hypothetical protein